MLRICFRRVSCHGEISLGSRVFRHASHFHSARLNKCLYLHRRLWNGFRLRSKISRPKRFFVSINQLSPQTPHANLRAKTCTESFPSALLSESFLPSADPFWYDVPKSSNPKNALPRTSINTWPLTSCPPVHAPPAALHAAAVKASFISSHESATPFPEADDAASHFPPVNTKARSIIAGPKNHCVVKNHASVTIEYRRPACTERFRLVTKYVCVKRSAKKAHVNHNHPILTKYKLKILFLRAK